MPNNKAYFVHDLFNNYVFAEKIPVAKSNVPVYKPLLRLFAYPLLIVLVGFIVFGCWYKFNYQQKLLNQVKQIIATDQLAGNQSISLHTLQQINLTLTKHKFILPLIRNKINSTMQQKISSLYNKKLNAVMLSRIKYLLLKNLQTKSLPPEQLYANLKTYIMLGSADNYDQKSLKKSLAMILTTNNKAVSNSKLLPYLDDFLTNYSPKLKLNHHLIASARYKLKQLDAVDLAFAILFSKDPNNQLLSLNFNTNSQAAYVFTFADNNINIPSIYTAQDFALIYPTLINQAANEAINGNWVIGAPSNEQAEANFLQVTQQLTKKYLANYADAWTQFIENIKIVNFTQLDHLITATKLLSNNNSPLLELAKLIQDNIVPQVAKISPMLKNFSTLANNILQPNSSQNIITALKNLSNYLQPITISDNRKKQTFEMTSIRLRNNGSGGDDPIEHLLTITRSYPEPIKSWLYNLTTNAWHLMLISSEDYINSMWQKNIIPQYDAQIADRFPFVNTENNDVSLTNFSYFFAPHGLLDKFFKDYLAAFIDSSQLPWKLKVLDGDSLPIYHNTLANLQRAFQIQRIYFRRADQSLYVPFFIQPLAIKNNTLNFTISLGNQQKTYQHGQLYTADQFVWPDDINSNLAKIILADRNNNHISINEHGPWAWFKLLQQLKIKPGKNKHYNIMLNKKDLAAEIDLSTQQSDNPFSLTLFQKFKLPDNL
jgi:intracellular multiplication protein IcmF